MTFLRCSVIIIKETAKVRLPMDNASYDTLSKELREALAGCDVLAGPEQLEYFYQLYDPNTDGFYYLIFRATASR